MRLQSPANKKSFEMRLLNTKYTFCPFPVVYASIVGSTTTVFSEYKRTDD